MTGEQEPELVQAYLGLDPISVCGRLAAALADAAHGWRVAADAVEDDVAEEMLTIARQRERSSPPSCPTWCPAVRVRSWRSTR